MPRVQRGFILIPVIIVVVIIILGLVFLKPYKETSGIVKKESDQETACPDPFIFPLPIDITKATSVLYPGQTRGGDYKAHGGFRFDNSLPNEITVTVPIDSKVVTGARYPVDTGDIQYTFEFDHPCGIRYRLGHLLTLTPKFQEIAEKFPMPKTMDSRTTQVYPAIEVKKGEIVATGVGTTKNGSGIGGVNTFLDWGVYDYRQKNDSSKDPEWLKTHTSETYQYAVCWFDWISEEDKNKVLSLPSSDSQSGKQSDYCK